MAESEAGADVVWYGERGALNELVLNWQNNLGAVEEFVSAIEWADRKKQTFSIRSAKVLVEISLADFGNPDLILVIEESTRGRVVFFIEGKLGRYEKCSMSSERRDKPGFNSSINGQLELKHRFVNACRGSGSNGPIEESSEGLEYRLDDPLEKRKLAKAEVLTLVRKCVLERDAEFRFVALTGDREMPLREGATLPRCIDRSELGWVSLPGRLGGKWERYEKQSAPPEKKGRSVRTRKLDDRTREVVEAVRELWPTTEIKTLTGSVDFEVGGARRLKVFSTTNDELMLALDSENTQLFDEEAAELRLEPITIGGRPFFAASTRDRDEPWARERVDDLVKRATQN